MKTRLPLITALAGWLTPGKGAGMPIELRGTVVIPHVQSKEMRYRREPDRSLGARVWLFLVNEGSSVINITPETPVSFRGKTPDELVAATFRGRVLSGEPPLDPSKVTSVGFLISDQQAGPFRLEVSWIKGAHPAGK